jgi:hypothetical protein
MMSQSEKAAIVCVVFGTYYAAKSFFYDYQHRWERTCDTTLAALLIGAAIGFASR